MKILTFTSKASKIFKDYKLYRNLEKKMAFERTWSEWWNTDSRIARLQNIATTNGLQVKNLNVRGEEDYLITTIEEPYYEFARLLVLGMQYELITADHNNNITTLGIYDYINDKTIVQGISSDNFKKIFDNENTDDHDAIKKSTLENNINFFEMNPLFRFMFRFNRFWHAYHSEPLKSTIITGCFVAFLIYLQSGILNFTPISSILLFTTLCLTVFLISSTMYVKTLDLLWRIAESDNNNIAGEGQEEKSSFAKIMTCITNFNPKFYSTVVLWITVLCSSLYFFATTLSYFAHSVFLTTEASSLLNMMGLFSTSLWPCFAVAIISSMILYGIQARFKQTSENVDEKAKPSPDENNTFLGIKWEHRTVSQILFTATKRAAYSTQQHLGAAIKTILDKTSDERLAITDGLTNITSGALENGNGGNGKMIKDGTDGYPLLSNDKTPGETASL